jgi:hypothetical protein
VCLLPGDGARFLTWGAALSAPRMPICLSAPITPTWMMPDCLRHVAAHIGNPNADWSPSAAACWFTDLWPIGFWTADWLLNLQFHYYSFEFVQKKTITALTIYLAQFFGLSCSCFCLGCFGSEHRVFFSGLTSLCFGDRRWESELGPTCQWRSCEI